MEHLVNESPKQHLLSDSREWPHRRQLQGAQSKGEHGLRQKHPTMQSQQTKLCLRRRGKLFGQPLRHLCHNHHDVIQAATWQPASLTWAAAAGSRGRPSPSLGPTGSRSAGPAARASARSPPPSSAAGRPRATSPAVGGPAPARTASKPRRNRAAAVAAGPSGNWECSVNTLESACS